MLNWLRKQAGTVVNDAEPIDYAELARLRQENARLRNELLDLATAAWTFAHSDEKLFVPAWFLDLATAAYEAIGEEPPVSRLPSLYTPCGVFPKSKDNHQSKISATSMHTGWCDSCGGSPTVMLVLFNRLRHQAWLCESCLNVAKAVLAKAVAEQAIADNRR